MKIKLNSNGQVINPPLRVAQRYIRLGRASVYVEPVKVPEEIIFREPEIKKPKRVYRKKVKIEEPVESQIIAEEEPDTESLYDGTDSGYSE